MKIAELLKTSGTVMTSLEAELLLCDVLETSKEEIYAHPEQELSQASYAAFKALVVRRELGEPLSYIIGRKEFYGRDFYVDSSTLIPRPETETLVDLVLETIRCKKKGNSKILELGTGSACIAITILLESQKYLSIDALELSPRALTVAAQNASRYLSKRTQLNFILADLFSMRLHNKYDLIISNPPYIPTYLLRTLERDVREFEPQLAIDGGPDGLRFYRKIALIASSQLMPSGKVFVEIDPVLERAVLRIFRRSLPEATAIVHKDLTGNPRVISVELT